MIFSTDELASALYGLHIRGMNQIIANDASNKPITASTSRPIAIANWLLVVAMLVFFMVVVGGITRLTESGLSITEWKPISGTLPPLNEADWASEFEKYKQIPEYQQVNIGMSMDDFKFIYFWEWVHRLLGRFIGLAFAIPFAWFWIKQHIPQGYKPRLLALLALGALQGTIGWWMVSSGLSIRTDVSHYRLAVHLLTALFIMAGLIWTALDLRNLQRNPNSKPAVLQKFSKFIAAILFIQLLLGAYVAGLRAGYIASDWPLMNDKFLPDGIDSSNGILAMLGNDPYWLHFAHRWWAWVLVAALVMLARRVKNSGADHISIAIYCALGAQIFLGIVTVMSGMNFYLAVLHQAIGAVVVATSVWGFHHLGSHHNGQRIT